MNRRTLMILLGVLVGSFVLKFWLVGLVGTIQPVKDERQYHTVGGSLALGKGLVYENKLWGPLYQPPLYPFYMGFVAKMGGTPVDAKRIQVLLSTLTVWFMFLLARRWFGTRSGLVAAGLFAFYPTLVAFTHYSWSETFFLTWLVAGYLLLFQPRSLGERYLETAQSGPDLSSARRMFAAGLVFGLAAQTRAVVTYLMPLLVLWILWEQRSLRVTFARGGALIGGFVLAILPWTLYIAQLHGGFLLISSQPAKIWNQSYNVMEPSTVDLGFMRRGDPPPEARPAVDEPNPVIRHKLETALAMEFIKENPVLCLKRAWVRFTYLFNPSSFLVRHLHQDWYTRQDRNRYGDSLPQSLKLTLTWSVLLSYFFIAALGMLGLFILPRGPVRPFVLVTIAYLIGISVITYATSRYRLPFMPLIMAVAAYVLTHWQTAWVQLRSSKRLVPYLLVLVFFLWVSSLYIDKNWPEPVLR